MGGEAASGVSLRGYGLGGTMRPHQLGIVAQPGRPGPMVFGELHPRRAPRPVALPGRDGPHRALFGAIDGLQGEELIDGQQQILTPVG